MKRVNRKAQILGMPFSVIFSIILIIFFIIAAIIAIKIFWNPSGCGFSDNSQEALFKQELQTAIDDAWSSERSDSEFKISLPGKITHVCFFNFEKDERGNYSEFYSEIERFSNEKNNFYLYPVRSACEDFRGWEIKHINITEITKQDNPYCVKNGKSAWIEKGFYDNLVKVR